MDLYELVGVWYLKGEFYVGSMNQSYLGESQSVFMLYKAINTWVCDYKGHLNVVNIKHVWYLETKLKVSVLHNIN